MELLEVNLESNISGETAIALGNFDGIHLGHRALLDKVVAMAKSLDCPASVLIFKNHTKNLTEGISQELLTSRSQKHEIFKRAGIDIIYEMDFDQSIMHLTPAEFVEHFLSDHLKIKGIVVGYDYRFGFKAKGTVTELRTLCRDNNIQLAVEDAVMYEGEAISSTRIRRAIKDGKPDLAHRLLGRPFSIEGTVVKGKQLGRTIGIPTANLLLDTHYVTPKFGVYLTRVRIEDRFYFAATNIGTNPTFKEKEIKVESYLYDYEGESLYGKAMEVDLIKFIRSEITFTGVDELKKKMDDDLEYIREEINGMNLQSI